MQLSIVNKWKVNEHIYFVIQIYRIYHYQKCDLCISLFCFLLSLVKSPLSFWSAQRVKYCTHQECIYGNLRFLSPFLLVFRVAPRMGNIFPFAQFLFGPFKVDRQERRLWPNPPRIIHGLPVVYADNRKWANCAYSKNQTWSEARGRVHGAYQTNRLGGRFLCFISVYPRSGTYFTKFLPHLYNNVLF